jgi:hypothetical protein
MAIGLYRTEWRGNLKGQFRENVIHYRLNPDPGTNGFDTANDLLIALNSTFLSLWLNMLPPDYSLSAIFARQIGPVGGSYATIDFEEGTQVGTRGTEAASQQLCPCITLIPGIGVKSSGRIFLPAVDKADYSMNAPSIPFQGAVAAFMNPSIAGFSVAGGTASIAIFSRKLNTSNEVSTYHLSPVIGYQRKRARPAGA